MKNSNITELEIRNSLNLKIQKLNKEILIEREINENDSI